MHYAVAAVASAATGLRLGLRAVGSLVNPVRLGLGHDIVKTWNRQILEQIKDQTGLMEIIVDWKLR